jgi:ribose 1,5-bisphosphokinase PhnN
MALQPSVLVFIGPSASGKSTVLAELRRRGLVRVHPTWSTRPPRPGEGAGTLIHRFVDDATFDQLETSGFFVSTGTIRGLPFRYGLPHFSDDPDGPLDAVVLRADYVTAFRRRYPRSLVYMVRAAPHLLASRLGQRNDPEHVIRMRAVGNRSEDVLGASLADRCFSNDGSISELVDAIESGLVADGAIGHPAFDAGVPA